MADNRFNNSNDDFEDIFSNSSKNDEFEDIFSGSPKSYKYDDISSFSNTPSESDRDTPYGSTDDYFDNDFSVKYNSAVQNRRRQEIQYGDVNDVYGDISSGGDKPKKNKKRHPVRNTVLILLALVIVALSAVGFYGYNTVQKLLSSFNTDEQLTDNEYISSAQLYSDPDQINILLVGVDAREGDTVSRSDTMMLLTIDNKNSQLKLTSFLRDSYVQIAGGKKEKLNASFFRGGIQMLADTLELNFKVDIPYYVLVDFEIFTAIVDELGGINVDVTEKESDYTYNSGKVKVPVRIEAGENVLLNGEQALWYSRIRYLDSDFMRTQRQRKVISAIVDKARQQKPWELLELAETIIPMVKTNLSSDEMMKFGFDALRNKAYNYDIVQQQIPADGTWSSKIISGVGDSLVMDIDENVNILHNFLQDKQVVEHTTRAS
ncbi:MAG: LCP family protein [Oscillospiraceae bacterium]|nr:LCP family protein [Oscillospiraceae bacterium]